jgi:pSer/pThr/pTyr-binding forkhead associated (FHA) protein
VPLRFRIRTAPSAEDKNARDRVVEVEPAGDEIRIGRRAGLEIQLPFATVSGLHARIYRQGNEWGVLDMGSSNGTFVGQTRLPLGVPRPLKVGDVIRVADVSLTFEGEVGAPPPGAPAGGPESTATLARRLVNDLFQSVGGAEVAQVQVTSGPASGQALILAMPDRPYRMGRSPDCDLVLPDDDVSREHAAIERRWQGVFIRDLGSKNGVQIDGQKIRGEKRLKHGDTFVLGTTQMRVDDPEEKYLRDIEEKDRSARAAAPSPGAPSAAAGTAPAQASPPASAPAKGAPPPPAAKSPAPATDAAPAKGPAAPAEPEPPPDVGDDEPGQGGPPAKERGARILPLFVSAFALAVLVGVLYLLYLITLGSG